VLFSEPKIPQSAERDGGAVGDPRVSVLFSEPKIPQSEVTATKDSSGYVSVLFSEPKIPQSSVSILSRLWMVGFSALQRAENSSIRWKAHH